MLNNNELQNEIYNMINGNIDEDERNTMNLIPEQIIPTIDLFKTAQRELIEMYFDDQPRENFQMGYRYLICLKKLDANIINIVFLRKLCQNVKINFRFTNDTIVLIWHYADIEEDIRKQYNFNAQNYNYDLINIKNLKKQIGESHDASHNAEISEESAKIIAKSLFK